MLGVLTKHPKWQVKTIISEASGAKADQHVRPVTRALQGLGHRDARRTEEWRWNHWGNRGTQWSIMVSDG